MNKWYIDGSVSMGNLDVFATDKALGDYRVCMIDCDDETVSEGQLKANARLITAAPDMLAALETALEMLVDSWGEEQIAAGDDQVANVLKAAITQAKGEA